MPFEKLFEAALFRFAFLFSLQEINPIFLLNRFPKARHILHQCALTFYPSLVLVFSPPLYKILPTRAFPPTRSPSINPKEATEPLDLPIPSVVLERPGFQGNSHPHNSLIFSTSSPNYHLSYRRFVRSRFLSDLVIFTSRSDFIWPDQILSNPPPIHHQTIFGATPKRVRLRQSDLS